MTERTSRNSTPEAATPSCCESVVLQTCCGEEMKPGCCGAGTTPKVCGCREASGDAPFPRFDDRGMTGGLVPDSRTVVSLAAKGASD